MGNSIINLDGEDDEVEEVASLRQRLLCRLWNSTPFCLTQHNLIVGGEGMNATHPKEDNMTKM